jgi:hypothetical protein
VSKFGRGYQRSDGSKKMPTSHMRYLISFHKQTTNFDGVETSRCIEDLGKEWCYFEEYADQTERALGGASHDRDLGRVTHRAVLKYTSGLAPMLQKGVLVKLAQNTTETTAKWFKVQSTSNQMLMSYNIELYLTYLGDDDSCLGNVVI